MKYIKLFESWGDVIDRESSRFTLIQKNHYLAQERQVGNYEGLEEAISGFLDLFKKFIDDEWGGVAKRYFSEWNPEVESIDSWDDFFVQSPEIGETTFYVEDFDPVRTARIFSEVDLLKMVHDMDPSNLYLETFLPFVNAFSPKHTIL